MVSGVPMAACMACEEEYYNYPPGMRDWAVDNWHHNDHARITVQGQDIPDLTSKPRSIRATNYKSLEWASDNSYVITENVPGYTGPGFASILEYVGWAGTLVVILTFLFRWAGS